MVSLLPVVILLLACLVVVQAGCGAGLPACPLHRPLKPEQLALRDADVAAWVLDRMSPVGPAFSGMSRKDALKQLLGEPDTAPTRTSPIGTVAVVGAGPAGLYAAIKLAATHNVVVYDKHVQSIRARFLGLFSRERDLLARLGLDPKKITYFPEGKETKRGILSADLDMGLEMVARRRGVRFCKGFQPDRLEETKCYEEECKETGVGKKWFSLHASSKKGAHPDLEAECSTLRAFDALIWAGGSRNWMLSGGEEAKDFPSRFFGSKVIPLEQMALRGLFVAWSKKKQVSAQMQAILDSHIYDAVNARSFAMAQLSDRKREVVEALKEGVYDASREPDSVSRQELAESVFADVKDFSGLERDAAFQTQFIDLLFRGVGELGRSFFVSNIAPESWNGYSLSAEDRSSLATLQATCVPDWLFLNLGVHGTGARRTGMDVRRLHWEGPLPHNVYQKAKEALRPAHLDKADQARFETLITYAVMDSLAELISTQLTWPFAGQAGDGRLSWIEYDKENPPHAKNAGRSASIFESSFAASTTTFGLLEDTVPTEDESTVRDTSKFQRQQWFIVGDAAQDAWYRFGLGVHDAFRSVDLAVNVIRDRDDAEEELVLYREYQALRALQITHAVFAGQFDFERNTEREAFAKQWMDAMSERFLEKWEGREVRPRGGAVTAIPVSETMERDPVAPSAPHVFSFGPAASDSERGTGMEREEKSSAPPFLAPKPGPQVRVTDEEADQLD